MSGTAWASRGGDQVFQISNVNIPAYGGVVLMKEEVVPVTVDFTCNNGITVWGQNVYVVGSVPELGSWNSANAIKLDPTSYPTWTGSVANMPASSNIEWKCIKRDVGSVVWQGDANNSVTTPASGPVSSSGSF